MKVPIQDADVLAAYRVLPSGAVFSVLLHMGLHFVHQNFPKEFVPRYEELVRLLEVREARRKPPPIYTDNVSGEKDGDDPMNAPVWAPPYEDAYSLKIANSLVTFFRQAQHYVNTRRERIPSDILVLAYALYEATTAIDGDTGIDSWTSTFASFVQVRLSEADTEAMNIWTDKAAEAGDLVPAETFGNLDLLHRTPFPALHSLLYGSTTGISVAHRVYDALELPYPTDRRPLDVLCEAATFGDRDETVWRLLGLVKAISQLHLDTHEACTHSYSKRITDLYPVALKFHDILLSMNDLDWEWHRPRLKEVATLWTNGILKDKSSGILWDFVVIRLTLADVLNQLLNIEEERLNPEARALTLADNPYLAHHEQERRLLAAAMGVEDNFYSLPWVQLRKDILSEGNSASSSGQKMPLSEKMAKARTCLMPGGASLVEWMGRYEALVLRHLGPWLTNPKPEGLVVRGPPGKSAAAAQTSPASLDTPVAQKPGSALRRIRGAD